MVNCQVLLSQGINECLAKWLIASCFVSVFRVCENGQCANGTHGATSEIKKSKHPESGTVFGFLLFADEIYSVLLALGVQQENIHFLWLCHSGDAYDAPTVPVPLPPARPPARDSPKHSSLLNRTPSDYDLLVPPLGCRLFADYMKWLTLPR